MPEETQVVEAAPSAIETPSLEIPRSNTPEYQQWRETGNLPDKSQPTKTEEAAPSSEPSESEAKPVGESETPEKQQELPKLKPKQTAEERIAQLEATIEKIRKGKGIETPKAESTPAPKPETSQPVQHTRPKPTAEDKNPDGTPKYGTYEDFVEELADWKAEQRMAAQQREQQQQSLARENHAKVAEAQKRYENFSETVGPFVDRVVSDTSISPLVKQMMNDSDVFADLAFVLAGDTKFAEIAKDPAKAIRHIAITEHLIAEELAKGGKPDTTARNDQGRFVKAETKAEPPAKRGPESAPAPPLEIGSRGTGAVDESDRALQAIERGDGNAVRAFFDAENRKDLSRRSGR